MKAVLLTVYLVYTSSTAPSVSKINFSETFYSQNYFSAYGACMAEGRKRVKGDNTREAFTCRGLIN